VKRVMTDEQRLFFEANGYLVFPNLLSPEELGGIRAVADRAEAEWRADPARPGDRRDNQSVVRAIIEYHPTFLDLLEHPTIFPIVRELLGDDISMVDNDYIITPPLNGPWTHRWHFDESLLGVYSSRSTMMVKVFYVLNDVSSDGGPTAFIPGSHRFPMDFQMPSPNDIASMPGHVRMDVPAGSAYLFSGRIYHAALPNRSSQTRRVLVFNYGHVWMKPWQGYEPSERLRAAAATPIRKQLLHAVPAYGSLLKE
jgi:ectoine hydroxylase-related dioxygenase (phytanoyl-CoA dioxygenase family)